MTLDDQIKAARKALKQAENALDKLIGKREAIQLKENDPNFGSIEWLVNNPNTPGHYEAMKKWVIEFFGGEYRGVQPDGYYHQINQQGFSFQVDPYGCTKEEARKNIHKFADVVLPYLLANEEGDFVSFTYASGQYSGMFRIDYNIEEASWYTSNMRYRNIQSVRKHDSLDAAIDFAITKSTTIDD